MNNLIVKLNNENNVLFFKQISFKFLFKNIATDSLKQTSNNFFVFTSHDLIVFTLSTNKLKINTFVFENVVFFYIVNRNQLNETLEQHFYFRFRRDFSLNSLTLFVKYTSSNFYKSKNYNEIIIDVQHKIN